MQYSKNDKGLGLTAHCALPINIEERVGVDAFWHHGDGEGWSFHSHLTIDSTIIYIDNFNYAVTDIVELIKENKLGLSDTNMKDIAQLAYALTKEHLSKKPTLRAHDAYYGI